MWPTTNLSNYCCVGKLGHNTSYKIHKYSLPIDTIKHLLYDCVFPYKEEIHFIVSKGTSCSWVPAMFKVMRQNNLWLSWRGWGWQSWWNPTIKGELEAWDILKKQNYYGNCEQNPELGIGKKPWWSVDWVGRYIGVLHPLHLDIQQ
jgi:hypothetical protein